MVQCGLDDLPHELATLVLAHVPPSGHRSLCDASRSLGFKRTHELVTLLNIPLQDLKASKPLLNGRLSNVTTVTITGPTGEDSSPATEQMQLVLFTVRHGPFMHLTHLTFLLVNLAAIISAAACMSTACPHLATLELRSTLRDEEDDSPDLCDLWPAVASLESLRHLKLVDSVNSEDAGLPGLGQVTQLQSVVVGDEPFLVSSLSLLVCLTKLTTGLLISLREEAEADEGEEEEEPAAPDLRCLSRLQALELCPSRGCSERDVGLLCAAFLGCSGLTSLRGDSGAFFEHWSSPVPLPLFTRLCRLHADEVDIACASLLALPALRELHCGALYVPLAGAGVVVTQLQALQCHHFFCPEDDTGDPCLPGQPVAQTLPRLAALKWSGASETLAAPLLTNLWPTAAAGRLSHLRAASSSLRRLPPSFELCAVALEELEGRPVYGEGEEGDSILACPLAALVWAWRRVGQGLRRVRLHKDQVDDQGLVALAGTWLGVEEVTLCSAAGVTDVGLVALARLPRLRRVELVRCPEVTASGVAALVSRWSVESIEVCACAQVSEAEVWRIHGLLGRPQLNITHSRVDGAKHGLWLARAAGL